MSKAQISTDYLEATKAQYLQQTTPEPIRRATVIGVDYDQATGGNIGWAITEKLKCRFDSVYEFNRETIGAESPYDICDTLVLCNGHSHLEWIENQPDTQIGQVIYDCLTVSIKETKRFVKATLNTPGPKYIVYIGSMAYRSVLNASAPYCAAKAGLAHFAKCVAWELAPKNYNVFCVNPSNTEHTPMTEHTIRGLMRYRNLTRTQAENYWGATLPKKEWLQKEDIAETVSWLVSGKADYLSGTNIDMAGGQR